jgi:hypothetical protein
VQEIAVKARLDQPVASFGGSKSGPVAHSGVTDRLAPLKSVIEQGTYIMQAVTREITDPNETILRGFSKQLGNSKKDIMALSKDLVVDQPADVAMEATRLAGEACDAIKASRESIRAALRELGAASDISEASGPIRAQLPPSVRPVMGNIDPEWAAGSRPAASAWFQQPPPPPKASSRNCRAGVASGSPARGIRVATSAHAGHHSVAPC